MIMMATSTLSPMANLSVVVVFLPLNKVRVERHQDQGGPNRYPGSKVCWARPAPVRQSVAAPQGSQYSDRQC